MTRRDITGLSSSSNVLADASVVGKCVAAGIQVFSQITAAAGVAASVAAFAFGGFAVPGVNGFLLLSVGVNTYALVSNGENTAQHIDYCLGTRGTPPDASSPLTPPIITPPGLSGPGGMGVPGKPIVP